MSRLSQPRLNAFVGGMSSMLFVSWINDHAWPLVGKIAFAVVVVGAAVWVGCRERNSK